MKVSTRRGFIKSAATAAAAALPTATLAFAGPASPPPTAPAAPSEMPEWWKRLTAHEKIRHHANELYRLMVETAPDGAKPTAAVMVTETQIVSSAFPQGWDHTKDYFAYDAAASGWAVVKAEVA